MVYLLEWIGAISIIVMVAFVTTVIIFTRWMVGTFETDGII